MSSILSYCKNKNEKLFFNQYKQVQEFLPEKFYKIKGKVFLFFFQVNNFIKLIYQITL